MKTTYIIDIETLRFRPGYMAPKIIAYGEIQFIQGADKKDIKILENKKVSDNVLPLLTHAKQGRAKIIGHNIAYDMVALCAHDPRLVPLVFDAYAQDAIEDTMLREQLYYIMFGEHQANSKKKGYYGLAGTADRRIGMQLTKDETQISYELIEDKKIKDWPNDIFRFIEYLENDVYATYRIYEDQEKEANELYQDLYLDSPAQARAYFALQLMAVQGMITDEEAVNTFKQSIDTDVNDFFEQVKDLYFEQNKKGKWIKKDSLLKPAIEKAYEGNPPRTDPTEKFPEGQIRTNQETLENSGNLKLEILGQLQSIKKLQTTYIPFLSQGIDFPIHSSYFLAETGRTTSRDPNIQNLPRKEGARKCFIPRKGYYYCACDYLSIEMVTLAQVCIWLFGHSELAIKINNGLDPHLHLAKQIPGYRDDNKKHYRQLAKIANFGYPGGMVSKTFVQYAKGYGVVITSDEAQDLRNVWFATWPEIKEYLKYNSNAAQKGNVSVTQFVSQRQRGGLYYNASCNTFFQGLAADGAKAACFDVAKACYIDRTSALYGCKPVAFIHDEILCEVFQEDAHESAMELKRIMIETMQQYVPDVKVRAEVSLMERWYKDAEPVYENNKLIPWRKS